MILDNSLEGAEVVLAFGDVPETLNNNRADFPIVEANEENYLLKIPRAGRYLVNRGNRITIQPENGAALEDVRKQSLTAVLAMLGYQRNYIMMHGGVVMIDGRGVLITGISAMGKSALLAALSQKGCPVISDDISYIKVINKKVIAFPSFPRIMLWKDSLRKLKLDAEERQKLRADMEKYFYPVNDSVFHEPVMVNTVCALASSIGCGLFKTLSGLEKTTHLRDNLFHPWMLGPMGKSGYYASQVLNMASLVDVVLLGNDQTKSIEELAELFIEKMRHA
ncbi:MAG: hypothetical protein JST70_14565 [Bacteroidetes bacterium]|nr:hypothetical protein [Bacteroidota bacterium]